MAPPARVPSPWTHDGEVIAVGVAADGRVMGSLDASGQLILADLELGRITFTLQMPDPPVAMVLTPSWAAVGHGGRVSWVNTLAGRITRTTRYPGAIRGLASDAGAAWLVAWIEGGLVLTRAASGRRGPRCAVEGGHSMMVHADVVQIGGVGCWSLPDLEPVDGEPRMSDPLVARHPAGTHVVRVDGHTVRLVDAQPRR